jgi:hypothetical protein
LGTVNKIKKWKILIPQIKFFKVMFFYRQYPRADLKNGLKLLQRKLVSKLSGCPLGRNTDGASRQLIKILKGFSNMHHADIFLLKRIYSSLHVEETASRHIMVFSFGSDWFI